MQLLTLRIVWLAVLVTPFLYVLIALSFLSDPNGSTPGMPLIRAVLYLIAIGSLAAQFLFSRPGAHLTRKARNRELRTAALPAFIVRCALIEASATLGLVLFVLTGSHLDLLLLNLAAVSLLALMFPGEAMLKPDEQL